MSVMDLVKQYKIIAIVRGIAAERLLQLGDALEKGNIHLMEITFPQNNKKLWQTTADGIAALVKHMEGRALIGAGTVLTPEQLDMAARAGAKYIITPNVNTELIRKVKEYGLCCFPGAMTPSEAVTAFEAGADAVKIFPAGILGTEYIRAIRSPLSHIPLMAVGGIHERNTADFLKAGCCAVGVGGNLVSNSLVEAGDWTAITEKALQYTDVIKS